MKIYLDTIGCRLNQAEIEKYAAQFAAQGHELSETAAGADWVIVNTCSVTAAAASDSRSRIRAAAAGGAKVAVTGCWSDMEPQTAVSMEGVSAVIPNLDKDTLVSQLLGVEPELFDREPLKRVQLPGVHSRTRAFIKVQDGCDNHCTFCVTRLVRGKARSVPKERVLRDVLAARRSGANEIVLTGVNLGAWGTDLETRSDLRDLVRFLLNETDMPRIRLSSLENWNLTDEFVRLWEEPRLCPHFHIPLQSASPSVLRRMARRTTPDSFRHLVETALSVNPAFAITTDVIAGFPDETEAEAEETEAFIQSLPFAGGHVFPYSPRPNTAAARMSGQLPKALQKARAKRLREIFTVKKAAFEARFIGTEREVLWESCSLLADGRWECHGLTDNYLTIQGHSEARKANEIERIRIEESSIVRPREP